MLKNSQNNAPLLNDAIDLVTYWTLRAGDRDYTANKLEARFDGVRLNYLIELLKIESTTESGLQKARVIVDAIREGESPSPAAGAVFECCGSANGFHLSGCKIPFPGTWDVPAKAGSVLDHVTINEKHEDQLIEQEKAAAAGTNNAKRGDL